MVYIGIDLGGTGIKIGVVDESGAILSQGETPTLAGRPYEDIIADMGRCMLDVMARGGFEEKDIASIGVGIPGVADEKTVYRWLALARDMFAEHRGLRIS